MGYGDDLHSDLAMSLLDSEAGKRRLLTIEIPVIERYNEGRDPDFQYSCCSRLGGALVLSYRLKPGHNIYQLETRLVSSYPTVPPETRVLTALKALSAFARRADVVLVAPGQHAGHEPLGSVALHLHLRGAGGVALAGVL